MVGGGGMERGGEGERRQAVVPMLVGLSVREARDAGNQAGVVIVSADVDGPPLGALTWPGVWIVTTQRPVPGTQVSRWENVVIEFEELRGGEHAGDREPRIPPTGPGALAAEIESPDDRSQRNGLSQ